MTPKAESIMAQKLMEIMMSEGTEGIKKIMEVILNESMKVERDEYLKAEPYERTEMRRGYANGYKDKQLNTRSGKLRILVPQVRGLPFYPKCIEKGTRSERALKCAVAEMYVQGVSTRRVTEITEELCGLEISSSQVSQIAKVLDEEVEKFKNRTIGAMPYLILDARYEKVRHLGCVRDVAVLIAIGVNPEGKREVLGFSAALSEAEVHWRQFLESLVQRGLHGVEFIVSDDHQGLKNARKAMFPSVIWQRCQFHYQQNVTHHVPKVAMRKEIAAGIRTIFNAADRDDAEAKKQKFIAQYKDKAPALIAWVEITIDECLNVFSLPESFRVKLRTSNSLEKLNREIARRTKIASIFPNEKSCLRLIGAVLVEIHEDWITRHENYLNMNDKFENDELKSQNFIIYRKKVA